MAKASKKAAAKAAAGRTKKSSNKKLTIDIGNLNSNEEQLKVLAAVHKAVSTKIKTIKAEEVKPVAMKTAPLKAGVVLATTATIAATFRDTEPGFSKLVATHKSNSKTITQSDTINFENVKAGDVILIDVITLGKSEITIDRKARPQEKKTTDSSFRFLFEILE